MSVNNLVNFFPKSRIKPDDGLTITAEIWDSAHEYHRQYQRFQNLLHRNWGIVRGLDVRANNPADTSVFILPGVAVDPTGQTIVLSQPVAYDIGTDMDGVLYVWLSYAESSPRVDQLDEAMDKPRYIRAEFTITAQTTLPDYPAVELARIQRRDRRDVFRNSATPLQPRVNEIDLRFRPELVTLQEATMAICYLGDNPAREYGAGAFRLAQALNQTGTYRLRVEDDQHLAPGIEKNTLIYLVARGRFELNRGQMNGLANFVRRGYGTLIIESADDTGQKQVLQLLNEIDLKLSPFPENHPLLYAPYFFTAPPHGYDVNATPHILTRDGVIFSQSHYGRLWRGDLATGKPSREQLRSAFEWGSNMVAYAIQRQLRGGY